MNISPHWKRELTESDQKNKTKPILETVVILQKPVVPTGHEKVLERSFQTTIFTRIKRLMSSLMTEWGHQVKHQIIKHNRFDHNQVVSVCSLNLRVYKYFIGDSNKAFFQTSYCATGEEGVCARACVLLGCVIWMQMRKQKLKHNRQWDGEVFQVCS